MLATIIRGVLVPPPLCAILLVENQQIEKPNEPPRDNQDPKDSEHGKRGIQMKARKEIQEERFTKRNPKLNSQKRIPKDKSNMRFTKWSHPVFRH